MNKGQGEERGTVDGEGTQEGEELEQGIIWRAWDEIWG